MKAKAKGLLEAVPLVEFLMNIREKKREIHNSLLQQEPHENDAPGLYWGSGRDPPTNKQPIRQLIRWDEVKMN
jgi:hypothetical protein